MALEPNNYSPSVGGHAVGETDHNDAESAKAHHVREAGYGIADILTGSVTGSAPGDHE